MSEQVVAQKEIIYVGDPMCSWCWGFAPVVQALQQHFAGTADVRLILGGLRPASRSEPFDQSLKRTVRPHWERVASLTGQPFNFELFDREGLVFDTERPSRAVAFARQANPALALPVFCAIEAAFFRDAIDVTQPAALAPLLAGEGLDADRFLAEFDEPDLVQRTRADFTMAGRLGAESFPTVILRKRDQLAPLTVGYSPAELLLPAAEKFFE
jgi:putative protein-disulfide isomerase